MIAAPNAPGWRTVSKRKPPRPVPPASGWPPTASRACPNSARWIATPSRCFWKCWAKRWQPCRIPRWRVERLTTDGSLAVTLEPIADAPIVELDSELGVFAGRDHWIHIREVSAADEPAGAPA